MTADSDIKLKIVTKMVRQPIVGNRKVTVDTVKSWVAKHDRGRAETLIRNMITDPTDPIEAYGGSRDNIRLSSRQAGIDYINDNGGTVPFGAGDDR
jgi:hypothetical protein